MGGTDRRILIRLLSLPILLASAGSYAQDAPAGPILVDSGNPPAVENAAGVAVDGWAVVRYSVLEDGSTDAARVISIAPPGADPAAVIESVAQWRFTPGSENGHDIDWHNNESVVTFATQWDDEDAPPEFASAYEAIATLIEAEDHDQAATQNEMLLSDTAQRRVDIGRALAQAAIIEIGRGDFDAALNPIQLATRPEAAALSTADYYVALQLQFQIESQLGRTRDALATYERIDAGYGPDEFNPFSRMASGLELALLDEEFMSVFGKLGATPWHIALSRPEFYIDDIDGRIDRLTVECDTRRSEIDFRPEANYRVLDRWGDCTVFVDGDFGTSFILVEVRHQDN